MDLNTLAEIVEIYLPAFIGALAQLFFLMLPVDLKNWADDDINILTYIGVQMFVACFIFIGIPKAFELYSLSTKTSIYILILVGVLGFIRVTKMIPLEATHLAAITVKRKPALTFNDFYDNQRMYALSEISLNSLDGPARYKKIKERIAFRKPEKVDQLGGG